jgi:translation initiation factor 2B subunit (eIF-2B alpha/beta/delta family)
MELAKHPTFPSILADRTHGASVLTQRLFGFLQEMNLEGGQAADELEVCREAVQRAHPAIVALDNALALVLERVRNGAAMGEAAGTVARRWSKAVEEVVARTAELVREYPRVMTISHSGIVRDALIAANDADVVAWVGEGLPGCEGLELARELADAGVHCTVYADAAFAEFLPQMELVLVGADAVGEKAFVNKTGTRVLLAIAQEVGVKTAVAYDPLKLVASAGLPARTTVVSQLFEEIPLALADVVITAEMGD